MIILRNEGMMIITSGLW